MERLWNAITGKRHWFTVRLQYHNGPKRLFSATRVVGVAHQGEILHDRQIKKLIAPTINRDTIKPFLCNGQYTLEVVTYLGRFAKPESTTAVTVDWSSIVFNLLLAR